MTLAFIIGLIIAVVVGAWASKRKITKTAERARRGDYVTQIPGERDEEYIERLRMLNRDKPRAVEQHQRDHPELWDPKVYAEFKKTWKSRP